MTAEKWFVFWLVGSTRAGDRNAGVSDFATEEEARHDMQYIAEGYAEHVLVLVHGTEVERRSA